MSDSMTMPPPRLPPQTCASAKRTTRSKSTNDDQKNMGSAPIVGYRRPTSPACIRASARLSSRVKRRICCYREQRFRFLDAGDERLHVALVVVDVKRRARGGRHVEAAHERLRAVMAGAHAHAVTIEDGRDIMRVHARERERHDAAARGEVAGSEQLDPFDGCQLLQRELQQLPLVRP